MSKEFVKVVTVTAAVSTVGLVGNSVHADEVTAPVSEISTQEVSVSQSQISAQELVVAEAKSNMDTVESTVSDNETALKVAQEQVKVTSNNVETASQSLENGKTTAQFVTPEVVKTVESDITSKESEISAAQEYVNAAESNVIAQSAKAEATKSVREQAQQKVNDAQRNVSEAEAAFDSAALLNAQKEVSRLEQKVSEDRKTISSLLSSISQIEEDQTKLIKSGETKRDTLTQAVSDAGPEYYDEKVQHEVAKNEVLESDTKTSAIDPTYTGKDGKTYYVVSNEDVNFDGEKTETIVLSNAESYTKGKTVDYTKVSQYIREYIIELRRINGIDIPVPEVTEKAIAWAKARANEMAKNNKLSHDTVLKSADFGLTNETENASYNGLLVNSSLDEKEIAYIELLGYFHDYENLSKYGSNTSTEVNIFNYGHRVPLLAASGTGFAVQATDSYGILTFVSDNGKDPYSTLPSVIDSSLKTSYESNGETRYIDPYSAYFLSVAKNTDSDDTHSEFYFNGKRVKFLPKTTFRYIWEEIVRRKNAKYEAATKALSEFNTKQAADEVAIAETLSKLKASLNTANQILSTDGKALESANAFLSSLTEDNAVKVQKLANAQTELNAKLAELKVAQDAQAKEEQELTQLDMIYSKSKERLSNLSTELDQLKAKKVTLLNAQSQLEVAQKAYQLAVSEQEKTKLALSKINAELILSRNAYEKANQRYLSEKSVYDAMVLTFQKQEEAKRMAALKSKYEKLVSEGKTSIARFENDKLVDYIVQTPIENNMSSRPKISVIMNQTSFMTHDKEAKSSNSSASNYQAMLPNTGNGDALTMSLLGLASIVLGLAIKPKKDEELV